LSLREIWTDIRTDRVILICMYLLTPLFAGGITKRHKQSEVTGK